MKTSQFRTASQPCRTTLFKECPIMEDSLKWRSPMVGISVSEALQTIWNHPIRVLIIVQNLREPLWFARSQTPRVTNSLMCRTFVTRRPYRRYSPIVIGRGRQHIDSHRMGRKLDISLDFRPVVYVDLSRTDPKTLHREILQVTGETPSRITIAKCVENGDWDSAR